MPRRYLRFTAVLLCSALGGARADAASLTGSTLERVPLHQGNNWAIVDVQSGKERVLLALPTGLGTTRQYWVVYVVGLNGTGMHQLTRPSMRTLEHGWDAYHVAPSWSADGRTVFFVVGHTQAFGAPHYQNPCSNVIALPADGNVQAIDGEDDPATLTLRAGNGVLRACRHAQWILP